MDWESVNLPVLPDYSGPNVRGLVPALLAPSRAAMPVWMPAEVRAARQVVLLVVDGLGWNQLETRRHLMPAIDSMTGTRITTVAPSTTATALTSITTGLTPGEHGVVGYRVDLSGDVVNMLRWATVRGDSRRTHPPSQVQPFPAFLGQSVPVVSRAELEGSGFTAAHMSGARHAGWRTASSLAVEVGRQLNAGEPFVYAYYDGVDKIAHERGFGEFYDAEVRTADRIVADVLAVLPPGAALVVTADHGQVQVGANHFPPADDVLRLVHHQSGEGRFRWLHARAGTARDLLDAARSSHGDVAWVHSRDEILDAGWFGATVPGPIASRLGDVALVARDDVAFDEPDDTGPYSLVCRHGSLTADEMYVPLLAALAE
jgi:predicted AlkP superfamily pyrophosphatase or phosphodiesterase